MINILIADDHPYLGEGLRSIISQKDGCVVAAVVANGEQVLSFLKDNQIDIVLMDIRMPKLNGIDTTKIIAEKFASVKVIATTGFDNENDLFEVLKAGAKGIILKTSDISQVYRAIDNVADGGEYFCPDSIPIIFRRMMLSSGPDTKSSLVDGFSVTEAKIIKEICLQHTSKEIADKMNLSEKTISYYRIRIMDKMKVKSSIGIVLYALKNNIVHISNLL